MAQAEPTKAQLKKELEEARARIAELERDQVLLETMLENSPSWIFFKDRQSRFIKLNTSHARMMGYDDPKDVIGKTDFDLFPREDAQRFYDEEQQIMASGQPVIAREWSVPSSSGEILWVSESKIPIKDKDGNVIGLVGFSTDITRRKRAEEALERAYAEMEQQVKERTEELEQALVEQQRLQEEIIEAQQRLIQELSTPIIPIMERIIVMPLIGSIDTLRARDIMRRLLEGITRYRAKVVILDITGVPIVDSGVAAHLNKTIQAARLKGAWTIVTGIADAVAETIVELGIDWGDVATLSDLQAGLQLALNRLGYRITKSRGGNNESRYRPRAR